MPLVSLAGGAINLSSTGTGRTQVVFVHGLGPGSIAWKSVIDELPETLRAFAIDLPGFGRSERLGFNGDIDSAATVLHRTLHAFGRTEPVTIVGHDYGALVSMSFSARFPSHVGRLALVSSGAFVRDVRGLGARRDEIALRGWGPEQADGWLRSGLAMSPGEGEYALLRDAAAEVDAGDRGRVHDQHDHGPVPGRGAARIEANPARSRRSRSAGHTRRCRSRRRPRGQRPGRDHDRRRALAAHRGSARLLRRVDGVHRRLVVVPTTPIHESPKPLAGDSDAGPRARPESIGSL